MLNVGGGALSRRVVNLYENHGKCFCFHEKCIVRENSNTISIVNELEITNGDVQNLSSSKKYKSLEDFFLV